MPGVWSSWTKSSGASRSTSTRSATSNRPRRQSTKTSPTWATRAPGTFCGWSGAKCPTTARCDQRGGGRLTSDWVAHAGSRQSVRNAPGSARRHDLGEFFAVEPLPDKPLGRCSRPVLCRSSVALRRDVLHLALAILPVVFFLGVVTYYRLLQTGVEDVIYARALSRIQDFYSQIDATHADLFHWSSVDQVGLSQLGLFRLRWQQFLSSAATIAIVNSVVGGVFIALMVDFALEPQPFIGILVGGVAAVMISVGFLRHQWATWMHVAGALPMVAAPRPPA